MSLVLLSLLMLSKKSAFTLPTGTQEIPDRTVLQVDSHTVESKDVPVSAAVSSGSRLWQGGNVPFRTSDSVEILKPMIMRAMEQIHNHTCVRFINASPSDSDYINITLKEGCWSPVGRTKGGQELSLDLPCGQSQGVILHELLHALGLRHEHVRSDRDNYVNVLWDNIQEEEKGNFEKLLPWENNLLDESFDFDSIMLYGSTAFSKDRVSPTLTSLVSGKHLVDLADKVNLSPADVRKINKLYECNGETRPAPVDVPPMNCSFQSDLCDFINQQYGNVKKWENKDGAGSLSWSDDSPLPFVVDRLFSPYMKSYHRNSGCLSFKSRFEGEALKSLRVFHQTDPEETLLLHEDITQSFEGEAWKKTTLSVHIDKDFRFVFEGAIVRGTDVDTISLRDVLFEWKACS